jgi:16S rRNA G966 N2-methylase RsmD
MKYKLSNFLNVRHSTRNLTDVEFEEAAVELSKQLELYDFKIKYTDEQLRKDWINLTKFSKYKNTISSTTRHGMKLCEHFMDNFWEIKDSKGKSFINQWNSENLLKVLKWNRKSHSTPYISEIRRGIYFCTSMPKSTMFRPTLSRMISHKYANNGVVLDPCAGWGGRMLGAISLGCRYIAFEPNTKTYNNLLNMLKFLDMSHMVTLYNDVAENIDCYDIPKVDLILTSPPYFNLEIYSDEKTQSVKKDDSYETWVNNFLKPVIVKCIEKGKKNVCSAWNVANVGKYNLIEDVKNIHADLKFINKDQFLIQSSKRQSNQNETKNAKSNDLTVCYVKI